MNLPNLEVEKLYEIEKEETRESESAGIILDFETLCIAIPLSSVSMNSTIERISTFWIRHSSV